MRKSKIILPIVIILLTLAGLGIRYVNKYILPFKAKKFITQTLEKQLGQKVSLEAISYNPLKGIVLTNLTVFNKEKPDQILLRAQSINFNCLILPIFKEKKVIIPTLNFNRLQVNLRRKENGRWNCQDLLSLKPSDRAKSNLSFLIYRVSLHEGKISFLDNYLRPFFAQEIENLNASATFSLPAKINFKLSASLKEKNPAQFNLKGNYNLSNKFLTWENNTKGINLAKYGPYYQNNLSFVEKLDATTDISSVGSLDKDWNLTSSQDISSANFSFVTDTYSGEGRINTTSQVVMNLKKSKDITYSGKIKLSQFNLNHLPYLSTVSNLTGTLDFSNDNISTQSLKGIIYDTLASLTGHIQDFANPKANLTFTSDLDLSRIRASLPKELGIKFADVEIKGRGHLQVFFSGLLKDEILPNIKAQLIVKDAFCKLPTLPYPFEEINSGLSFKENYLVFEEGEFSYNKIPYQFNGSIAELAQPRVKLNLTSEKLTMNSDFSLEDKNIHINQAQGKYLNSDFEINGDIFDISQARLNLYGNINFDLADLEEVLPYLIKDVKVNELKEWGIKGLCPTRIFINGLVGQAKNLEVGIKSSCPSLSIKKINLGNTTLDFKMKEGEIDSSITARPYYGSLNSKIIADLNSKNIPYEVKLNLNDLNLKALMKDLDLRKKNIAGYLSAQGNFNGYGSNLETLKGRFWVEILNGNLWEVPLLGDLSNILNIPGLRRITFKQAHGNFTVAHKQIITKDLALLSKEVTLSAQGTLAFDGKIDALVSTTFDPEFIKQTSFLGTLISGFGSIIKYHIYNTIAQPKFEKVIGQPQIDKNLPIDFLEGFKKILQGIEK